MTCSRYQFEDSAALVGDPVDVVSGANVDRTLDFQLTGPIRLLWVRHYDSSQNRSHYALGWGHTHEFDQWLRFDVDGLRYAGILGRTIGFPPLKTDGQRFARGGLVLHRISAKLFRIYRPQEPALEFEFGEQPVAPVTRLLRGGSSIRFHYNESHQLFGITDSTRRRIRVACDEAGHILTLSLEDAAGQKTRTLLAYGYDEAGNLVAGEDPYRSLFSFRYDRENRMIARTDRIGYSFVFEYDKQGRCVRTTGEDGLLDTRLQYHTLEKVTVVTRADGGVWTYLYPTGKLNRVIDPYGGSRELKRDESGRVTEEIDANGNVTRRVYDSRGALVRKISPLKRSLPVSAVASTLGPNERILPTRPIEFEYGNSYWTLRPGEAISLPRAHEFLGKEIPHRIKQHIRTYDPEVTAGDEAIAEQLPVGRRVYDDFGKLVKQGGPNGTARRWLYDRNGNVVRITDCDGSLYTYKVASWDLRQAIINPLAGAINFKYTRTQKLSAMKDRGGSISEYEHDLKDRLVCVRRHGVVKEQYRYDNADNVIEKLDGKGLPLLSMEIGPGNLTKSKRLASGQTHAFGYDENGRLLSARTDSAEVLLAYDRLGNRVQDERNGLGVTHRFGAANTLLATTYFKRYTVAYKRLGNGKLSIADPRGVTHTIQALGRGLMVRTLGCGSIETAQFDQAGRCLMKATMRRRADLWLRKFSYSAEGDLLAVTDNVRGAAHYRCDAAHRLVGAELPGGEKQVFDLDMAGNLLRQPGLQGVVLDEGNRLAAANGDRFEYNDRNHVASRVGNWGTTRYSYDSVDMLTSAMTPDFHWTAEYDALGRRIGKAIGEKRTEFYWDKERLVAEVRADGNMRLYLYVDEMALTPFMFLEYESVDAAPECGKGYYLHGDHRGTPLMVEDDIGRTVWSAHVDPYGFAQVDPASTIAMFLRFPGHYFDPEIGLHCNGFRYYSPELGRYLQSDPAGIGGGPNLYAYSANPLKRVDVMGLCPAGGGGPTTTKAPPANEEQDEANEEEPETLWEAQARGVRLDEEEEGQDTSRGRIPSEQEEDERLQAAADAIHKALQDDRAERDRTVTVIKGQDANGDDQHIVRGSEPLTQAQKDVARDLLGPNVDVDDSDSTFGKQDDHSNHGEQNGIAASDHLTDRVAASSSGAGHGGASCVQCQKAMDDAGIRNATGSQLQPSGDGDGRTTGSYGESPARPRSS
jgi:RHS repeat-associated protein